MQNYENLFPKELPIQNFKALFFPAKGIGVKWNCLLLKCGTIVFIVFGSQRIEETAEDGWEEVSVRNKSSVG